ncbi:MAG: hypothetical protein JXQ30_01590 [Spirochaetes bacterium]|nr:hypothetical protein [Spirochaetota bacterium]
MERKNEPYLVAKKIVEKRGIARLFGYNFILPLNKEKKWDAFLRLTDRLVPDPGPRVGTKKDRCAVVVELRRHPHLSYVLRNVAYFLGESWRIHIFCGLDNEEFVREIVQGWGGVSITNLGRKNYSKEDYSRLLLSCTFWRGIEAEHVLIFQTDSILRRRGIEEFLRYDYVGAPWLSPDTPDTGGNGGLSLRRKSVMLSILKSGPPPGRGEAEDVYFCRRLDEGGYNTAPKDVALRFSVEELFHPDPLGTHIPRQLCNSRQINWILLGVRYGGEE